MIIREFADVLESVEESMADGQLEAHEAAQIRRDWEDLKSAGEMLVVTCEKLAGVESPVPARGSGESGQPAAKPARRR